ncbi:MAG TPA: inositol monophosphatase family protein [Limnochordia bacterium]|nr:inositol monophosphatase family protein [Limnochordia bacterium]
MPAPRPGLAVASFASMEALASHRFDFERIGAELPVEVRPALPAAHAAGVAVGQLLYKLRQRLTPADVHQKGAADVVTAADFAAEQLIVERLDKTPPGCRFLLEEQGSRPGDSEWAWVADPLDGTANYVTGRSIYCCSIALCRDRTPYVGVIVAPALGLVYVAAKGGGAWLNGERIHVSAVADPAQAFITTGMAAGRPGPLAAHPFGAHIRCYGSCALELADVAAGRSDAHVQLGLNPWDMAAGALMVLEAGGCVSEPDGSPFRNEADIAAANAALHGALIARLQRGAG